MHKWLAKSHFTIFSTSLPQRRGLTIFCREPSTKKGSCWLPDACGFHVAGVTGGSRGRKCGTPRHCISRIIHFFSYSHSPAAPRSIQGFWLIVFWVHFLPLAHASTPSPSIFLALENTHMFSFLRIFSEIPPRVLTCFPLKPSLCYLKNSSSKETVVEILCLGQIGFGGLLQ